MLKQISILLSACLLIAAWNYGLLELSTNGYFKLLALGLFMCFVTIYQTKDRLVKTIASIMIALCFSNILDEFFFNPIEYNLREYISALLAVCIGVFEYVVGWELLLVAIKNYIKKNINGKY